MAWERALGAISDHCTIHESHTNCVFLYIKQEWHTFSRSVMIANLYVFSSALLYRFQNHIITAKLHCTSNHHVTYLATPQDISPEGGDNDSTAITIPVVLTSNTSGEAILVCSGRRTSVNTYMSAPLPPQSLSHPNLTLYTLSPPPLDPSAALIFIIAVTTVLLASYLANTPWEFLRSLDGSMPDTAGLNVNPTPCPLQPLIRSCHGDQ